MLALPDSHALARQMETERIEEELRDALAELRGAVRAYHADHGAWPGADPDRRVGDARALHAAGWLARQLLMRSDSAGRCAAGEAPSHPFGPYLPQGLPLNPVHGRGDVRVLGPSDPMPDAPDGLSAWIYDPLAGELRANCEGRTQRGARRFFDL